METRKIKSLVTGGAGFIGSHVAKICIDLNHDVVVLDDLSGGFIENIPEGARFVKGSVADHVFIENLFETEKFDYVYHLAAYAAEGLSHFIRRFNYNNNLIGSINLINESIKHDIKCFVFTSSIAVYGKGQNPITESQIPMPEDPYGISKYSVELDLKNANKLFGLNSIIFRPHNVYGEHQNIGDKYRNVIGIFINQAMQREPMTIFGDGSQTRAFSYIDDVAPIIAKSINYKEAYNEIYNVGADNPYTVLEVAHTVADAMGIAANITFLPPRNEVDHAYSSHDKVQQVFGASAGLGLSEGIRKMTKWAQITGPKSTQQFENIEILKNLPPSWAGLIKQ